MTAESTSLDAQLNRELNAARVMLREGRQVEAGESLHGILTRKPDHMEAMRLLANTALATGNPGQAIDWLNRAANLDRNNIAVLLDLGVAYRTAERLDAARYVLERVLELTSGQELTARLLLAHVLEKDQRPELALLHYFRAVLDAQHAGRWLDDASTEPSLRTLVRHAMNYVDRGRHSLLDAALRPVRASSEAGAMDRVQRSLAIYLRQRDEPRDDPRQQPRILYVPGLGAAPVIDQTPLHWMAGLIACMATSTEEIDRCLQRADGRKTEAATFSVSETHATYPPPTNLPAPLADEMALYVAGKATEWTQSDAPNLLACLAKAPLAHIPHHGPEVSIISLPPSVSMAVRHGRTNAHCSVVINLPGSKRIDVVVGGSALPLQPGESLVLDPSFGMGYTNASDSLARVLVFDIWHPKLSALERDALSALFQAIVDFDTRLQELA
ncbi:MAG: tetratricopeptide repeat protein [Rhodanobacter sp.]